MYLHVADARLEKSCTERGEVGTSGGVNNALLPVLTEEASGIVSGTQEQSSDSKLDKDAEPRTSNLSEGPGEAKGNLDLGQGHHQEGGDNQMEESMASKAPLRALTTLKWPYIPEAPSYPDPLARDDPKPLSLAQYEEIGELLIKVSAYHSRCPCNSLVMNRVSFTTDTGLGLDGIYTSQRHLQISAKPFLKIQIYPASFELWILSAARNGKKPSNACSASLAMHRA